MPLQEIAEQLQADALALLGVELHADQIVAADRRHDGSAVIDAAEHIGLAFRDEMIGVHEIRIGVFWQAAQDRMR
jgi:hypothetical protein